MYTVECHKVEDTLNSSPKLFSILTTLLTNVFRRCFYKLSPIELEYGYTQENRIEPSVTFSSI